MFRDTALNHCLKHLLTPATTLGLSGARVEAAAQVLLAVNPWMQDNWGYASHRYLDGHYFCIQGWCAQRLLHSKTQQGWSEDDAVSQILMVSPDTTLLL